ncbi:MAG: hypothetical protein RIQ40_966, partial [Planctomycetota bacterium]
MALEAARAINDLDINAAMPGLAALGDRFTDAASSADVGGFTADNPRTLPLLRRVIAANRRVSDPAAVARLAELARSSRIPPAARLLAMEALAEWAAPGPREPVQGHVIIIDPASRDQAAWKRTLTNRLPALVTNAPDEAVRDKARELAAKAGIALDSAAALRTALDTKADSSERIACLKQLEQEGGAPLDQAVRAALASSDPALRAAARDALARRDPAAALPVLRAALNEGSGPERQAAIRSLASIQSPEADTELATLATSLLDGSLAPALQLDVSEAYLSRASKENPVAAWKAAQSSTDPLA